MDDGTAEVVEGGVYTVEFDPAGPGLFVTLHGFPRRRVNLTGGALFLDWQPVTREILAARLAGGGYPAGAVRATLTVRPTHPPLCDRAEFTTGGPPPPVTP